ncbi:MAG: ATP-binding protein [Pirellulales bacterium]
MPVTLNTPPTSLLNVLLVQDDPLDRARFSRMLQKQFGHRVTIRLARDAAEAFQTIEDKPVDVALIDSRLPDMFGLEMIDRLSRDGGQTATILVASQGGERLAAEALKHGAKDYVIKEGLDGETLARAVNQALSAKRLQQENARMAEQLQRTQAQMDHFLRAISHDMGANLMLLDSSFRQMKRQSVVPMPADGSNAPPPTTDAAAHVEACLRESHRFLRDLSQLSSTGSVAMEPELVDLQKTIDEVLFEQKTLLDERGAKVSLARPLPTVWCNVGRVRQVFTNLIRNALKHGCDEQNPRLVIAACQAPAGRHKAGFVWLAVADNGPGIPLDKREEIFLPGKRLPSTRGDGTGLGLAIVKKVIDHYGGEILVDPTAKQGAKFLFSLPLPK